MGMAHIMRAQSVGNVEKCKANTQKVTDIKERASKFVTENTLGRSNLTLNA